MTDLVGYVSSGSIVGSVSLNSNLIGEIKTDSIEGTIDFDSDVLLGTVNTNRLSGTINNGNVFVGLISNKSIIGSLTSPLLPKESVIDYANRIVKNVICVGPIGIKKLVNAVSSTHGQLADYRTNSKSRVLGISIDSGNNGETIRVLLFGLDLDVVHNFGLNDVLFLGEDGEIENTPPSVGYLTNVGYSQGIGSVFVQIESPIFLG